MFKHDIVPFVNGIRDNIIGWDKVLDDMVHRPKAYTYGADTFPKDNVFTQENTIVIELALAGYTKDDISIERETNFLIVKGNKVEREEDDTIHYTRRNIATRSFEKRYTVSPDYKDIRAKFKDGILSIHLEKEPEKEVKQLIEIS